MKNAHIVPITKVTKGMKILREDGEFHEVLRVYPAANTYFVQFRSGQGWHCPSHGKVFVEFIDSRSIR